MSCYECRNRCECCHAVICKDTYTPIEGLDCFKRAVSTCPLETVEKSVEGVEN